jgi:hypothetical protein
MVPFIKEQAFTCERPDKQSPMLLKLINDFFIIYLQRLLWPCSNIKITGEMEESLRKITKTKNNIQSHLILFVDVQKVKPIWILR